LVSTPKGWESSAQGNALGDLGPVPNDPSPKGWESLSQPFGLGSLEPAGQVTQGGALG
jgi:hypothetical protein